MADFQYATLLTSAFANALVPALLNFAISTVKGKEDGPAMMVVAFTFSILVNFWQWTVKHKLQRDHEMLQMHMRYQMQGSSSTGTSSRPSLDLSSLPQQQMVVPQAFQGLPTQQSLLVSASSSQAIHAHQPVAQLSHQAISIHHPHPSSLTSTPPHVVQQQQQQPVATIHPHGLAMLPSQQQQPVVATISPHPSAQNLQQPVATTIPPHIAAQNNQQQMAAASQPPQQLVAIPPHAAHSQTAAAALISMHNNPMPVL